MTTEQLRIIAILAHRAAEASAQAVLDCYDKAIASIVRHGPPARVRTNAYLVRSRSMRHEARIYTVAFDGVAWHCDCEAKARCWHVVTVEATAQADAAALPFVPAYVDTYNPATERPY